MDTKSKSWRPAVSFLAFFLSVSLLLGGGLAALFALNRWGWTSICDTFRPDYQDTAEFRLTMASYLRELLSAATGTDTLSSFGSASLEEATVSFESVSIRPVPQAVPVPEEVLSLEGLSFSAGDKNLLYTVSNGRGVYSNAGDVADLEDYNFKLTFDGWTVTIERDGATLDVYGDGYYREERGDWFVPGYRNYPTPEAYQDIQITLLAAREPVRYQGEFSRLYEMTQRYREHRTILLTVVALPLAAGLALFLWYLAWRRDKAMADRSIAAVTGHVWLEVKLVLLVVCIPFLLYQLCYLYHNSLCCYLLLAFLLWGAYLCCNDLRYNHGSLTAHSFCTWCAGLFRTGELRYPVQRRMARRAVWQFAFTLPFIAASAVLGVLLLLVLGWRWWVYRLFLLAVCLAGLVLIAVQIRFLRRSQTEARGLGTLLDRIQDAYEGDLTGASALPEDPDLRLAADQLVHIERGLRTALEEQVKSERMKVELIANVSHDLKTPLTSILSYADLLLQEEGLPDHVRSYIQVLNDKALRLKSMVQEVFEVSKAASGNLPVTLEPLDLSKLLRQTLADMAEDIEASPVTFRVQLPEKPVYIRADGDRLYRVFQNLIQNALRYSLDGSRVYLDLHSDGQRAEALLRNTSRDELPAGVDFTARFVRGDQSRTDGGSGLGLSIARTFTEACSGAFRVQVEADLFTAGVSFPVTAERPAAECQVLPEEES